MGLTLKDTYKNLFDSDKIGNGENSKIIALAGNPNVGKSTVFNALTGLKQHTGNWSGKTVANAVGKYTYKGEKYTVMDLPGTYSLISNSREEEVARDFIYSDTADTVVIVADATCLERNLNLALQIMEMTDRCVLCINLIDEATRRGIVIDTKGLEKLLGIPVIAISASKKKGVAPLLDMIKDACAKPSPTAKKIMYDKVIEESLDAIGDIVKDFLPAGVSARFASIRLLCGDEKIKKLIDYEASPVKNVIEKEWERLEGYGVTKSNISDKVTASIVILAEKIASEAVSRKGAPLCDRDARLDRIITSKTFGIPIMICLWGVVIYLSVAGANYPSRLLADMFDKFRPVLGDILILMNCPEWLYSLLISGVYATLAQVVSVMLPPMAIFFPLFTILEDLGYLPRMAFNLDGIFQKCRAHGKQCLTMCMGLGCNAAGVTGARIIDSPKERIIAIVTNNFMPCNGRFPILIALSAIFFASDLPAPIRFAVSSASVLLALILGVAATFASSYFLSSAVLKSVPSQCIMELPPYRRPKFGEVIYRSVFDRTLFVLARAVAVAAPFGAIIKIAASVRVGDVSLLGMVAGFLEPFGRLIGLDGYILTSFILGLPANEIVLPILLMCYSASDSLNAIGSFADLGRVLMNNGWSVITAVNMMIFTVFHFPCSTTLLTIYKETKSVKWTLVSLILPTSIGIILCFIVARVGALFI